MTQKELQIIKNADFSYSGMNNSTYKEMQRIVGDITDNFTHPENISTEKIDMTSIIKDRGYSVDLYKKTFGSVMRSEEDVCKRMIEQIKSDGTSKKQSDDDDAEELILIAEAEAEALTLMLKMRKRKK